MNSEQAILAAIERIPLPEPVERLIAYPEVDSMDRPAIRVWVILKDDHVAERETSAMLDALTQAIRDRTWQIDERYWPYVRVRSVSEQALIESEHG